MAPVIPFMKEPNVHESFSLMLLERIEQLEKENQTLKKDFEHFKQNIEYYQRYHYFKFEKLFKCRHIFEIRPMIRALVNTIMVKRSQFQPLFAVWGYDVTDVYDMYPENSNVEIPDERYFIRFTMYIRNHHPYSILDMVSFLNDETIHVCYLSGGLYQLKFIIKEWISYQVLLPYLNENNRIEIWTKGGLLFDYSLNPTMTEDIFTSSNNYLESEALQEEYFKLIQMKGWNEIFGILEYI